MCVYSNLIIIIRHIFTKDNFHNPNVQQNGILQGLLLIFQFNIVILQKRIKITTIRVFQKYVPLEMRRRATLRQLSVIENRNDVFEIHFTLWRTFVSPP